MNVINLGERMEHELDLLVTTVTSPDGGRRPVWAAISADGRLWLDPAELGIGPQHAPQLAAFPGGKYLLIHPARRLVLINARAVVLVSKDAAWRQEWLACVERILEEHQKVRARWEAARNN